MIHFFCRSISIILVWTLVSWNIPFASAATSMNSAFPVDQIEAPSTFSDMVPASPASRARGYTQLALAADGFQPKVAMSYFKEALRLAREEKFRSVLTRWIKRVEKELRWQSSADNTFSAIAVADGINRSGDGVRDGEPRGDGVARPILIQVRSRLENEASATYGEYSRFELDPNDALAKLFNKQPGEQGVYSVLTRDNIPFALALENSSTRTIWTRPFRLRGRDGQKNYTVSLFGYLAARSHSDGYLIEWRDSANNPERFARFVHGQPDTYQQHAQSPYIFEQDFRSDTFTGTRYLLGADVKDQVFQLHFGVGKTPDSLLYEKIYYDGQGLPHRAYVVQPFVASLHAGTGTVNSQMLDYARRLGIWPYAGNRSPEGVVGPARKGASLVFLNKSHAQAYDAHADLNPRGTADELIKNKQLAIVIDGFDGKIPVVDGQDRPIPVPSTASGKELEAARTISVSQYMRQTLLRLAPQNGIPVLYQGGSKVEVPFIHPFLLSVLGIPFEEARGGNYEHLCFSCNGTTAMSLVGALALLKHRIQAQGVYMDLLRRAVDFPRIRLEAPVRATTSHHTGSDILTYLDELGDLLSVDFRSLVNLNWDLDEDGHRKLSTLQTTLPTSFFHMVIANVRTKTKGERLTEDELRTALQAFPNLAVVHIDDFFEWGKADQMDAAIGLKEKGVNRLTPFITDALDEQKPALTPVVVADLPDKSGIAIGAFTFQKHNVVPAVLANMLLHLKLVPTPREAVRRAMEIMGLDRLKFALETGPLAHPDIKARLLAERGLVNASTSSGDGVVENITASVQAFSTTDTRGDFRNTAVANTPLPRIFAQTWDPGTVLVDVRSVVSNLELAENLVDHLNDARIWGPAGPLKLAVVLPTADEDAANYPTAVAELLASPYVHLFYASSQDLSNPQGVQSLFRRVQEALTRPIHFVFGGTIQFAQLADMVDQNIFGQIQVVYQGLEGIGQDAIYRKSVAHEWYALLAENA